MKPNNATTRLLYPQNSRREKEIRPESPAHPASRDVVSSLEPRLVYRLQRRRGEGQILAIWLWIRHEDGDQVAAHCDNLVDHRGAADADGFARHELRNGSAQLQQLRVVGASTYPHCKMRMPRQNEHNWNLDAPACVD